MSLHANKSYVITGGSGGIGRATAIRLASSGARVLVTGTNAAKLDATKEHSPHNITTFICDAGTPSTGEDLAAKVKSHFPEGFDGLFLNAGFAVLAPHTAVTAAMFDKQFAVNVRGPMLYAGSLSPLLHDNTGSILINTSIGQHIGMQAGILYNSTKGALRTAVRVLAKELSPRGIRANAVSPGPIETDFLGRAGIPDVAADKVAKSMAAHVPLGRMGSADEVAAVACFLLSSEASYVTGAEFTVDGGMRQV